MKDSYQNRRSLRWGALFLLLLVPLTLSARTRKSDAWVQSQFEAAERTREALNGRPAEERTRREYKQAITAYQRVYFGAPASSKAAPSVVASAELMVEMGRRFDDDRALRSAIKQYEFLRREYPGSRYRFDALFTIGEIYKDDLNDLEKARETFQEFLRRYPRNHLAEQAKQALAEPAQPAALKSKESKAKGPVAKDKLDASNSSPEDIPAEPGNATVAKSDKIARVTGIRHWSTPDYTRVAIDLEQDVKYESQRIDHPERIFFDLMDTKLASTLVGKSFDVDDGFLKKIRVAQFQPGRTRIVLEVDDLANYNAFLLTNPSRLIIDIHGKPEVAEKNQASKMEAKKDAAQVASVGPIETDIPAPKPEQPVTPRAKAETEKPFRVTNVAAKTGPIKKIVQADDDDDDDSPDTATKPEPQKIEVGSKAEDVLAPTAGKRSRNTKNSRSAAPKLNVREAQPTANGDRSLTRALGLKIGKIVIDPGHGGHDTGTIGSNGLEEKNLVLDVSLRLGKLLASRLGAEVVYTRRDDTFIPLETRTAIANREQADLFVSVHANSSRDSDARGVETYYLNFTSSPEALEVAARENAVSEKSIHELQDLVKKIALKEKIDESKEFASDVQRALRDGLATKNSGIRNRGVKKAPFIVLIGANMPSILAEISFVSNPEDERRLKTAEYRQHIAESLYRGISKYVSGLSGIKVASALEKSVNQ